MDTPSPAWRRLAASPGRSEEHTSELQSLRHLVCRLLLEKKQIEADVLAQPLRVKRPAFGVGVIVSVLAEGRNVCQLLLFFFLGAGPPKTLPLSPTRTLYQ